MTQEVPLEVVELILKPIPPDTVASVKAEVLSYIQAVLKEQGRDELLANGQIIVEVEKTFPTDQVVNLGLTLLSSLALETFKAIILPKLKERFETKRKRRKGKGKK